MWSVLHTGEWGLVLGFLWYLLTKYYYSNKLSFSNDSFFFFGATLQDACLLGALEDGLNALLSIEVRVM